MSHIKQNIIVILEEIECLIAFSSVVYKMLSKQFYPRKKKLFTQKRDKKKKLKANGFFFLRERRY